MDLKRTSRAEERLESEATSELDQSGAGEERAGKWAVLAIVAIGVFMATLDSSIVNISPLVRGKEARSGSRQAAPEA